MQSVINSHLQTIYWDNGNLKRSIQFDRGIRSGFDRMWNEEGILVDESFYENGKPTGSHRRWNRKGQLIEEILYKDEKRFSFSLWDEEGTLKYETFWVDDLHYVEKAYEASKNKWVEKRGKWDGKRVIFETEDPLKAIDEIPTLETPGDFSKSFALFMERFPKLGLLVSREIKPVSSECIADCKVGKAEAIYVYGIGNGFPYFQLKKWLHDAPSRILIFLEDDLEVFPSFLHNGESFEMLSDRKVHIEFLSKDLNEIDAMVEKYPFHRVEVFAIPSKKGKHFESLKMSLFRKTTLSHAIQMDRMYGYFPFENFVKNAFRMHQSFYANRMKGAFENLPAIVCGAGPSLNQAIPLLKTLSDKAILIAGGSTLAALSAQGVPIHFGMAIDPNLEEYRRLKNSFALETPILYSTRVHPSLFQTCNGPFGYMRSGIGGILELWMEEALEIEDFMIGQKLSPESISVTTICAAWAEFIGCKTIIFCGVDLSYSEEKRYAEGVGCDEELIFSELDAENSVADRILKKKNNLNQLTFTATRWVMEAASLGDLAKKHKKASFFNTSEKGLKIPGVPFLKLEKVVECFSQSYDIASMIQGKIVSSSMPENSFQKIEEKLHELKTSIERVIKHLEAIIQKKPGLSALAEIELHDELAMDLLFYDTFERLGKISEVQSASHEGRWDQLLSIANKYLRVISLQLSG